MRSEPECCRFQSEPTKCLEYTRDQDKPHISDPLTRSDSEEDKSRVKLSQLSQLSYKQFTRSDSDSEDKRKLSVTFAEAECNVREFVPDKDLVMLAYTTFCCYFQSCPNLI